jgi:hypothetical protein
MKDKIHYINYLMDSLNDLSVDLYEAMADGEDKEVISICEKMLEIIRQIRSDHNSEFTI